jgi:hypothetical protein
MIVRNYYPSMMLGISCFILPKQRLEVDFHSFTFIKGSPYPASTGAWAPRPLIGGPWRASSGPMRTCDVGESDNRTQINYLTETLLSFTCTGDAPRIVVQADGPCPTGVSFSNDHRIHNHDDGPLMRGGQRPQVTTRWHHAVVIRILIASFTSAKFQRSSRYLWSARTRFIQMNARECHGFRL